MLNEHLILDTWEHHNRKWTEIWRVKPCLLLRLSYLHHFLFIIELENSTFSHSGIRLIIELLLLWYFSSIALFLKHCSYVMHFCPALTLAASLWPTYARWCSANVQCTPIGPFTTLKFLFLLLKGILPQKNFYRPNLIFWIVMGCGRARFGRKGQKTPKIENFGLG